MKGEAFFFFFFLRLGRGETYACDRNRVGYFETEPAIIEVDVLKINRRNICEKRNGKASPGKNEKAKRKVMCDRARKYDFLDDSTGKKQKL